MRGCHRRPRALFPATADIANSAPDSAWPFAELGCQQVAASGEGPVWLGAWHGKALETAACVHTQAPWSLLPPGWETLSRPLMFPGLGATHRRWEVRYVGAFCKLFGAAHF